MNKINILLLVIMISLSKLVSAQVTGDYRSASSGNWDALATWQMFNGTTWVAATVKPGTTNNVLVGLGFNVTANTNEACKDLIVQDGSALTMSHNIVNSGNVSVGGIIDLGISTLQNKGGGGSNENFTIGGSPVSLTGDITSGSTTVVIVGAITGVVPGMTITGTGIPVNTCVLAVSGFNLILSQPSTATASGITFSIHGANTIKTANPLGIDGSIIQISRNFTDGASYVFNAPTTTPFPAATPITAKDITLFGSITLNDPVSVTGNITLNSGILTTSNTNLLTISPTGTTVLSLQMVYVNGPLQITLASTTPTTLFFPIGKDSAFRPVSLDITQNSATPTTYKAEAFNIPPVSRTLPSSLDRVSFNRYYNIVKGAGASVTLAHITLNYDIIGIDDGVTDASNLRVAKDNGLGGWVDLGGDVTSVNFTGSIKPANFFTTFGDFVLANNIGGSNLLGGHVPSSPTLINPANLEVNVPITTSLVWNSSQGATTYRLMLATDQNFTNIILNDSTLTDTTRLIGPLQNNTNYFWKINGKNFLGTGIFSTTFSFTTIVSIPGVPVLVSPADSSTNQALNSLLTWNAVPFAATYGVQVSTDSSFSTIVFNDSTITATSVQLNSLTGLTQYFWRVKAINIAGTGGYSAIFKFQTVNTTGINDKLSEIPTVYNLYQNYPNPFNPSTVIKFDIPESGLVTMKVYNIIGKEVRSLVNDYRDAGKYNITFDAAGLPSGIYFFSIKSNNFSSVKKMMLLK